MIDDDVRRLARRFEAERPPDEAELLDGSTLPLLSELDGAGFASLDLTARVLQAAHARALRSWLSALREAVALLPAVREEQRLCVLGPAIRGFEAAQARADRMASSSWLLRSLTA